MARIILIETSTSLCSTALIDGDEIISSRESGEPRAHASKTAPFIQEMLQENGLKVSDCDAVCVSMGPGSYTGLRVGVSTAKGLCFGAGIPLLAVGTLDILAAQALSSGALPQDCRYIVPMIDARRMEVYSAVFDAASMDRISEIEPRIIGADSYASELQQGPVLFIGDGAGKCASVINSPNAHFMNVCPDAKAMKNPALREFESGNFKDTAYFEPFYLKEFIATVSKKNLF